VNLTRNCVQQEQLRSWNSRARDFYFVFALIVLYGYFYQGGGANQNSHFDTSRSLVERGSFEITEFAHNTTDTSTVEGRIYSNKPPGLPVIGAAFYLSVSALEQFFGINPTNLTAIPWNLYLLTFLTSGLAAIILVLRLRWYFVKNMFQTHPAKQLAVVFGIATLCMPYATIMMSHVVVACALFCAFMQLFYGKGSSTTRFLLLGVFLASAMSMDYLTVPLVPAFLLVAFYFHGLKSFWALAEWSFFLMFGATSINPFIPYTNIWPHPEVKEYIHAPYWNFYWIVHNQVSISTASVFESSMSAEFPGTAADKWDAYNVGELLGLEGMLSIVPVLLVVGGLLIMISRECRGKNEAISTHQ